MPPQGLDAYFIGRWTSAAPGFEFRDVVEDIP
jgi:hypothetical protein